MRSYSATLALRTLLTVRLAAGPCATYVADLYGNLRDLADAYRGEDWRPLVRVVHRQPKFKTACGPRSEPKIRLAAPGLVASVASRRCRSRCGSLARRTDST